MSRVLQNSLTLKALTAGAVLQLTGEKGTCYFLYRPEDPSVRHYIGYSAPTDIGLTIRQTMGYNEGLLQTIAVGIININLGLEAAGLRLVEVGYFDRDGNRYISERSSDGVRSLVEGIIHGRLHIKYRVEPLA